MADSAATQSSGQREARQARRSAILGVTVDLVLATLMFFMGLLVQANSPIGKGPWLEMSIALAVLLAAAALGWWLFKRGSRWGEPIIWSPIPLCILAILISMAMGY